MRLNHVHTSSPRIWPHSEELVRIILPIHALPQCHHGLKKLPGCSLIGPCVLGLTSAKRFHNEPDFDLGVNASREGLIEIKLAEKWHWHDMALSEHGFYAPKRFTIRTGLTNTKVKFCRRTPSKMSKHLKSFLNWSRRFPIVFGSTEGSDDMNIA